MGEQVNSKSAGTAVTTDLNFDPESQGKDHDGCVKLASSIQDLKGFQRQYLDSANVDHLSLDTTLSSAENIGNIRLNTTQLLYSGLNHLSTIITNLLVPDGVPGVDQQENTEPSGLQNLGSILLLNILLLVQNPEPIFQNLWSDNLGKGSTKGRYCAFRLSTKRLYIQFHYRTKELVKRIMSYGIPSYSFVWTMWLVLFMPLILMLTLTILVIGFSVSAVNSAFTHVSSVFYKPKLIRKILVYFAERIPPSVGQPEQYGEIVKKEEEPQ